MPCPFFGWQNFIFLENERRKIHVFCAPQKGFFPGTRSHGYYWIADN